MNRDPRRNAEGYLDPTAYKAIENVQRQLRGKKSKAAGGYFENMISRACTYYRDKNIAYIEKTPEPMKVLKPMPRQPGRFIACFVKAARLQSFYRVPWLVWRDMKKLYGRQYLKLDELSEYEITAQGGVIRLLEGII